MIWQIPPIWKDEEVWILGGGPSLSKQFHIPQDVIDKVASGKLPVSAYSPYLKSIHNKPVIGINMAYKLGDWVDMVFFGDDTFPTNDKASDLREFKGMKVTCHRKFKEDNDFLYVPQDKFEMHGISSIPTLIRWNYNSGAAAISIAAQAGAKRIILVGFDMSTDPTVSHWHNQYGKTSPAFQRFLRGFPRIAQDAINMGIQIINASPSSAITHFIKMTVDEILTTNFETTKLKTMIPIDIENSIGNLNKYDVLQAIHSHVKPNTYLEIGVCRGCSLKLSTAKNTIGIDPMPQLRRPIPNAKVFTLKSDEYFNKGICPEIDMSFIDGMHHIENVLQDFINVEKNSKKSTVIIFDDIAPAHPIQGLREKKSIKWAGDVWKIVPILKRYRPDLIIKEINAAPTGMLYVTNLDKYNTVLSDKYKDIVKEWIPVNDIPVDMYVRPGYEKDLNFLKETKKAVIEAIKTNKPKIGLITPTCSKERANFVAFLRNRIEAQTLQPDVWEIVDYPNKGGVDLSKRYKDGIKTLLDKGCDVIFFIEDDDYYPVTYIEQMVGEWEKQGRPDLFGVDGTIYYHLKAKKFRNFPNKTHCSAFCTGVGRGVKYNVCGDNERSFDLLLWKANQGVHVDIKNRPIGIKHGISTIGGDYHNQSRFKDLGIKITDYIDKEAMDFYESGKWDVK